MKRLFLLIATPLALLLLAAGFARTASANDAALGAVGSSVMPLANNQVMMAAERIEAEIRGDQGWVTCVFTFTNSGPATEVLMGFPERARTELGGTPELRDFTAEVDGMPLPVSFRAQAQGQEGEDMYAGWHTFMVPFEAGQTRVVRNTYHGPLTLYSTGDLAFDYILHTGAGWQGRIGQVDIVVRWSSDLDLNRQSAMARPESAVWGDRQVSWRFADLEPTMDDDISFYFRPSGAPLFEPEPPPGMPRTGLAMPGKALLAILVIAASLVALVGLRIRLASRR